MVNYVAVIPGKMNINGKEEFRHSEQHIYKQYLKDLLSDYIIKNKQAPKAMVLYSWAVPCYEQPCTSQGTTGCTSHTINALKGYTGKIKVIIAFTAKGGGMNGRTKCDAGKTKTELKNEGISIIRVWVDKEEEQEAMIESLVKLGRLMQILE